MDLIIIPDLFNNLTISSVAQYGTLLGYELLMILNHTVLLYYHHLIKNTKSMLQHFFKALRVPSGVS